MASFNIQPIGESPKRIKYSSYEEHLKDYILTNCETARDACIFLRTNTLSSYDKSEPTIEEYLNLMCFLDKMK